ncbi:hypothetical protein DYB30_012731 [Aphanomyces astaci]|uniref:Uncharacterized protein n=1 Tax=Aphanomyces astaci TaxID=112090 RepID=A0A397EUT8_APHAT|nr:hypothetical protein DYB34_011438 [Aphanomyces astaci]RHY57435.1 hypothetical protein DYB30_012731 [Aphanomyces astaci]RHY61719.1 hypothetical protein DYB38_012841 [Aphanomyces astaci]RHZ05998.1 hypothetical protein DYB31_007008 [Aphanomyces astaci]RHZ38297.1 hypothetical protein DYB26_014283 [Aphanomyces astaci]
MMERLRDDEHQLFRNSKGTIRELREIFLNEQSRYQQALFNPNRRREDVEQSMQGQFMSVTQAITRPTGLSTSRTTITRPSPLPDDNYKTYGIRHLPDEDSGIQHPPDNDNGIHHLPDNDYKTYSRVIQNILVKAKKIGYAVTSTDSGI